MSVWCNIHCVIFAQLMWRSVTFLAALYSLNYHLKTCCSMKPYLIWRRLLFFIETTISTIFNLASRSANKHLMSHYTSEMSCCHVLAGHSPHKVWTHHHQTSHHWKHDCVMFAHLTSVTASIPYQIHPLFQEE